MNMCYDNVSHAKKKKKKKKKKKVGGEGGGGRWEGHMFHDNAAQVRKEQIMHVLRK